MTAGKRCSAIRRLRTGEADRQRRLHVSPEQRTMRSESTREQVKACSVCTYEVHSQTPTRHCFPLCHRRCRQPPSLLAAHRFHTRYSGIQLSRKAHPREPRTSLPCPCPCLSLSICIYRSIFLSLSLSLLPEIFASPKPVSPPLHVSLTPAHACCSDPRGNPISSSSLRAFCASSGLQARGVMNSIWYSHRDGSCRERRGARRSR